MVFFAGFLMTVLPAGSATSLSTTKHGGSPGTVKPHLFPIGTINPSNPSGMSPPTASDLPGYSQSYFSDFNGNTLPLGWDVFTGTASGDPGSQWGSAHVVVANGLLTLSTWRDSAYGNEWVTGGLCHCERPMTYGAYFVRSRESGTGPTIVELLWPTSGWPPEIDFNETSGLTSGTSATNIWSGNHAQSQVKLAIDMTQWHTWGVIWTPSSLLYTVDGNVWGRFTVPSEIPNQPMTLHLQQQTWCTSGFACPTTSQSTQIDWVAEYAINANDAVSIGPFQSNSWFLSPRLKSLIVLLAYRIQSRGDLSVAVTAYSDPSSTAHRAAVVRANRALVVRKFLAQTLSRLQDNGVVITATGLRPFASVAARALPPPSANSSKVMVRVY